jgi:putative FmdB family regulatory protein
MPLYEFECDNCGWIFDIRASIQEKEAGLRAECPRCRNPKTQQVITTATAIHGGGKAGSSGSCCDPNSGRGCCG